MRLTAHEATAIKAAARDAFGASVAVRLFGSRVRDSARGGDIDLHLEIDPGRNSDAAIDRFETLLFGAIEPQRVDLIFAVRGAPAGPFQTIGYRDGILL
ncbi:nucleotidyltransferase domain-containing protein [Sandaracinobacteroides saxicola]|uniref:Nucleotidyltransferase domain-containing protein n=1 Tax=Sandaracinobacteroides saxicola TaxID=2759707 RepID=A0A7G5IF67_9SPHN|nr:nucleotidyltransferase domain-containing protein [Sandaracinobacteroides saxicola]QMW22009.1 nucleotidyltransferase domain-containing protein [Sandaracinobacteroides saxicola]